MKVPLRLLAALLTSVCLTVVAYKILLPYSVDASIPAGSFPLALSFAWALYAASCVATEKATRHAPRSGRYFLKAGLVLLLLYLALVFTGIACSLVLRAAANFAENSQALWELLYRSAVLLVKLPLRTALSCLVLALVLVATLLVYQPHPSRSGNPNAA